MALNTVEIPNTVGATFRTNINNAYEGVGTNFSGTTTPTTANTGLSSLTGALWFNTNTSLLQVHNGSNFVNVNSDTLTNQTITLSGDASGSGTTAITVTVANNSHTHNDSTIDSLNTSATTAGTFDARRLGTDTPASGEVLTANSSSSASWQAASGGIGDMQTFVNSGTWNRPSGVNTAWVTVVGGGGGGVVSGFDGQSGGPGGSGATIFWRQLTVNGNVSVTVGNGGNSGTFDNSNLDPGNSGGTSSFGNTTCNGGAKGNANASGSGGNGTAGEGLVNGFTGRSSGNTGGSSATSSAFGGAGEGGPKSPNSTVGAGRKGIVIVAY